MAEELKSERRLTLLALGLATFGAVIVLLAVALALLSPSPPRDLEVIGGFDEPWMSCGDPILWTGEVAYAACAWVYDRRALLRVDLEAARAEAIHRWTLDDGNSPELRIVGRCGEAELFVIGETAQTTIVRAAPGGEPRVDVAPWPGEDVLGAACTYDQVELFLRRGDDYAVARGGDTRETLARRDAGGAVAAAWRGETGWRTIAFGPRDPGQALLGGEWTVGPPGAGRETISGATDDACVVGEPGGWLFFAARGTCIAPGELIVAEGGRFIAVPGREDSRPEVLATGDTPDFGFVLHHPPSDVAELHGPGTEALGLARRADAFTARGGKRPTAVIAKAAGSSLLAGAHLFPLSGSRTAIWGGLGKEVVIVDGALARVDAMGPSTRLLRPFGRFEASAKSTFDQVRYFAVLFGAPLWLLALAALRRGGDRKCLRRVALGYVLILLVGAGGFVEIVGWI